MKWTFPLKEETVLRLFSRGRHSNDKDKLYTYSGGEGRTTLWVVLAAAPTPPSGSVPAELSCQQTAPNHTHSWERRSYEYRWAVERHLRPGYIVQATRIPLWTVLCQLLVLQRTPKPGFSVVPHYIQFGPAVIPVAQRFPPAQHRVASSRPNSKRHLYLPPSNSLHYGSVLDVIFSPATEKDAWKYCYICPVQFWRLISSLHIFFPVCYLHIETKLISILKQGIY